MKKLALLLTLVLLCSFCLAGFYRKTAADAKGTEENE